MIRQDSPALMAKIEKRTAKVGVVGLGYVGLPLALTFREQGFPTLGVDIDPNKIESIKMGRTYIKTITSERISEANASQKFEYSTDFAKLAAADAVIICVPTPLNANREPDMTFIENSARAVAKSLRPGQLVVLESSTYPGTTNEVVRPILEATGLKAEGKPR